jgi:hypothetical protein
MTLANRFLIAIFTLTLLHCEQIRAMFYFDDWRIPATLAIGLGATIVTLYTSNHPGQSPVDHSDQIIHEIDPFDGYIEEVIFTGRIDWEGDHAQVMQISDNMAPFIRSIPDIVNDTVTTDQRAFLLSRLCDHGRAIDTTTSYPLFTAHRHLMNTLRKVHQIVTHGFIQRFQRDSQHNLRGPVELVRAADVPVNVSTLIEQAPLLEKNIRTLMLWLNKTPELQKEEHDYRAAN